MSVTRLEDDAPAVRAAVEDPTRLEELVRTRLLDSPREEAFDRLTRLAARHWTLHLPKRRPWELEFRTALARLRTIPLLG